MGDTKGGMAGNAALLHDLLKLNNRLMAPFSTHLAHRYRISLNEFRLLMTIGALGRTASHEVAELTGVNVMSVSRAVATLERHGRVAVVRDESNRRRKWLTLTEEGQRLYEAMRPQTDKVAAYLFDGMDQKDIAALTQLVAGMIARLEAKDASGRSAFLEATRPEGE
ncbi:MarR family winged helix-turn-helix transcriptional regulator [Alteraurantiacibacter palmitatis]|uniref:MarR family winged helix-turn-helix transcriptional regulator n=1 Tax=Alteraurantiacibacter palmitatis TaxID=2054628 RepID=A0ABV7E5P8_9SPHN